MTCLLAGLVGLTLGSPAAAQLLDRFVDACLNGQKRPVFAVTACDYALHGVHEPASRATLLIARARAQLLNGHAAGALADADGALAANPASAAAHDLRGLALQRLERADDAAEAFAQAIALAPFDADARVHRAAMYFSFSATDRARRDIEDALAAAPDHAEALVLRGLLDMHAGQYRSAAGFFQQAADQSPVRLPYAAVWFALATGRAGGDMAIAIAPYAWWWDDGAWPRPIVDLIADVSAPEPLADLLTGGHIAPTLRRVQAAFALAQWHLARGDPEAGQLWLRYVVAEGETTMAEVVIAREDLARYGK